MIQMYKYLPIGTIVLLKNGKTLLMIIGYPLNVKADKNKSYDYIACLYPIGIISLRDILCFNHNQIDKVYYMGYKNDKYMKMDEIFQRIGSEANEK